MSQQSIISKAVSHRELSAAFHNCDMLTLYFHIFPESWLSSYLPCFDFPFAALKLNGQTDCLDTVSSLWEKRSTQAASEQRDRSNQQVIFGILCVKTKSLHKTDLVLWLFDSVWLVHLSCRAICDDQAPHLVYLTSWVWHSVSASVSLSNTPSEVSLAYSSIPSWVTAQTAFHARGDVPDELETLFLWNLWHDQRSKSIVCNVVEEQTCRQWVMCSANLMQIILVHEDIYLTRQVVK